MRKIFFFDELYTNSKESDSIIVYEKIAEKYALLIEKNFHNAFYEKPAMISLLPAMIAGLNVLDVGCGPGAYTEWFIEHKAYVVAIDRSSKMIDLARKRLAGRNVQFYQADIRLPLSFIVDNSIDIVIAPLVMHYLEDWKVPLQEFARILKKDGLFIFSIYHPSEKFSQAERNYFSVEKIETRWKTFDTNIAFFHRPMSEIINALLKAGFIIEGFIEPLPVQESKVLYPEQYAKFTKDPMFVCLKARIVKE